MSTTAGQDQLTEFKYIKGLTPRRELGLHLWRLKAHLGHRGGFIAAKDDLGVANTIAQRAMTLVKDEPEVVELRKKLELSKNPRRKAPSGTPRKRPAERRVKKPLYKTIEYTGPVSIGRVAAIARQSQIAGVTCGGNRVGAADKKKALKR